MLIRTLIISFMFEGVLLAMGGYTCVFRTQSQECLRTLKTPNSPPLTIVA